MPKDAYRFHAKMRLLDVRKGLLRELRRNQALVLLHACLKASAAPLKHFLRDPTQPVPGAKRPLPSLPMASSFVG